MSASKVFALNRAMRHMVLRKFAQENCHVWNGGAIHQPTFRELHRGTWPLVVFVNNSAVDHLARFNTQSKSGRTL